MRLDGTGKQEIGDAAGEVERGEQALPILHLLPAKLLVVLLIALNISVSKAPIVLAQPGTHPTDSPELTAAAAVLMDYQTGHVLYSCQASKRLAPASTTKVLTALLGLELGRENEVVTVSPYAAATEGSSLYLKPGLRFDLRDLIKGALVNSGNDAAVAIGEHLAGTESNFAALMTYKAETIGALQSTFVNPHGLDNPGHCCTAYDLALITRYALSNTLFRQYVQTREDVIYEKTTQEPVPLSNTNRLLWSKMGDIRVFGVKTGTTSGAGQCLIAAALPALRQGGHPDGQVLIAVVLDSADRYGDTLRLLRYGYDQCRWTVLPRDRGLFDVPVVKSRGASVRVGPAADVCFAVSPEELPLLESRVTIRRPVMIGLPAGAVIGRLDFYLGDGFIFGTDLKTLTPAAKKSILLK